jgi:hypothetical protein
MAYVPGYAYDLFMSYAHEDNTGGWIDEFHSRLITELLQLLGRPFSKDTVYFDKRSLEPGQDIPSGLEDAARNSACLVALVSPGYASSPWCQNERDIFQETVQEEWRQQQGVAFQESVGDSKLVERQIAACVSRFAVINVRNVSLLPEILTRAPRTSFVKPEKEDPWEPNCDQWNEILRKLADQIKRLLWDLRRSKGKVFLGSPLRAHWDLREDLENYLSEQNFSATPDPLALLSDRKACQEALSQAACAVHFIGGATDSALQVVEDSCARCDKTILFKPFAANISAPEKHLIDQVFGKAQRIDGDRQELKNHLMGLLSETSKKSWTTDAWLHLVCHEPDFPWARKLQKDTLCHGIPTDYPRFLSDPQRTGTDNMRCWKHMIRYSKGLLFYLGLSDDERLRDIWNMAKEEKTHAETRWYLDEPRLEDKRQRYPDDPVFPAGLEEFLGVVRHRAEQG